MTRNPCLAIFSTTQRENPFEGKIQTACAVPDRPVAGRVAPPIRGITKGGDKVRIDGPKLRAARMAAGLSIQQAGDIACMSESSISRIETKGGSLNRHICRAMAKAYNVAVGSFEAPR